MKKAKPGTAIDRRSTFSIRPAVMADNVVPWSQFDGPPADNLGKKKNRERTKHIHTSSISV